MIFALDYDGTYSEAPNLWDEFIMNAQEDGHTVIIATSRNEIGSTEYINPIPPWLYNNVPIVFCNHNYKDEMCRKKGYIVDVWIDDVPESCREPR